LRRGRADDCVGRGAEVGPECPRGRVEGDTVGCWYGEKVAGAEWEEDVEDNGCAGIVP
jgi:hypothetical protein